MMKSIIHIGGNKTGSTLLQKNFFPKLNKFTFINPENTKSKIDLAPFNSLLTDDDIFFYKYEKNLKKFLHKKVIFSSEDILGSQFTSLIAIRLKKVFGMCKILFVIRNQISAINSWYISHGSGLKGVPRSYWRRYVNFSDWLNFIFYFSNKGPIMALDYWSNYKIFEKVFGEKNIKVLLYEDLKYKPFIFYKELGKTFGVKTNFVIDALENKYERKSRSNLNLKLHQIFKSYNVSNNVNKIAKFFFPMNNNKTVCYMSTEEKNRVISHFNKGNALLSKKIGINLNKIGYP